MLAFQFFTTKWPAFQSVQFNKLAVCRISDRSAWLAASQRSFLNCLLSGFPVSSVCLSDINLYVITIYCKVCSSELLPPLKRN